MIYVRATLILGASRSLAKATTIAIRYSSVRRQGYLYGNEKVNTPEFKVLDYGSQQYSLFPLVAQSFALLFTSNSVMDLYSKLKKTIDNNDFSLLPEVHATCSGLKAFSTWMAASGIEECRQRCGGAGFLQSSGLPELFASYVPTCTFEGDNNVLVQQTARYLIKVVGNALKNETLIGNTSYFSEIHNLDNDFCKIKTKEELLDPKVQLAAYTHKAIRQSLILFQDYENAIKNGMTTEEAWNFVMSGFFPAAKAHSYLIMVQCFITAVSKCENSSTRKALKTLCDLFCLYHLEEDKSDLLIDGYFTGTHIVLIRNQIRLLLQNLRRDIITITDSWCFSDNQLNSVIGRYDGRAYENLFSWAKKDTFFKNEVVDGFKEYIYPLLHRHKL